jgi:hypothetical protein
LLLFHPSFQYDDLVQPSDPRYLHYDSVTTATSSTFTRYALVTTPSVTILVEYGRPECTFARDTRASGRRPVIDTNVLADTVHD